MTWFVDMVCGFQRPTSRQPWLLFRWSQNGSWSLLPCKYLYLTQPQKGNLIFISDWISFSLLPIGQQQNRTNLVPLAPVCRACSFSRHQLFFCSVSSPQWSHRHCGSLVPPGCGRSLKPRPSQWILVVDALTQQHRTLGGGPLRMGWESQISRIW